MLLSPSPLILTLHLDKASFHFFDHLRQRYFPPERNFLKAHLTLFHHLPHTAEIIAQLAACAKETTGPLQLHVTGLMKLGGGVAYRIESTELTQLHRKLQQLWQPLLTAQDRQPLRPHVTVQNKVPPAEALKLYDELVADFKPFAVFGQGLCLWEYQNGPWQWLATYDFEVAH